MMSPMSISSINIATAARLPADAPETSTLIMKTLIYTQPSLQLEICDGHSYVVSIESIQIWSCPFFLKFTFDVKTFGA